MDTKFEDQNLVAAAKAFVRWCQRHPDASISTLMLLVFGGMIGLLWWSLTRGIQ
jgi:hypothetical protein